MKAFTKVNSLKTDLTMLSVQKIFICVVLCSVLYVEINAKPEEDKSFLDTVTTGIKSGYRKVKNTVKGWFKGDSPKSNVEMVPKSSEEADLNIDIRGKYAESQEEVTTAEPGVPLINLDDRFIVNAPCTNGHVKDSKGRCRETVK